MNASEMTDAQIVAGLEQAKSNGHKVAESLLASRKQYGGWTVRQAPYARSIAHETLYPVVSQVGMSLGADMLGIVERFKIAKAAGLKHPVLHFPMEGPQRKVTVSLAPDTGVNAGCLYVRWLGLYVGKIDSAGMYKEKVPTPGNVLEFLREFALDPQGVGARKGKECGCCCYCGSVLNDERSLSAGYGPVCAKKWGLAWGAVDKQSRIIVQADTDRGEEEMNRLVQDAERRQDEDVARQKADRDDVTVCRTRSRVRLLDL